MGIQAQEDALFQEWKSVRPGFVADGAADEEAYLLSGPRILFMLKEVNDPKGGDWDLRKYIKEGGQSYTWNNITRWVEGIRNLPVDIPWRDLEYVDEERRVRALRSIAAVNLKKSPGSHTSDPREVAIIAAEDKALLNKQFRLYQADLIICCGVSEPFHWLITFDKQPAWRQTSRGIAYHEYVPGKFVVAYAHPEARIADSILYYGLIDAIREIIA